MFTLEQRWRIQKKKNCVAAMVTEIHHMIPLDACHLSKFYLNIFIKQICRTNLKTKSLQSCEKEEKKAAGNLVTFSFVLWHF